MFNFPIFQTVSRIDILYSNITFRFYFVISNYAFSPFNGLFAS